MHFQDSPAHIAGAEAKSNDTARCAAKRAATGANLSRHWQTRGPRVRLGCSRYDTDAPSMLVVHTPARGSTCESALHTGMLVPGQLAWADAAEAQEPEEHKEL